MRKFLLFSIFALVLLVVGVGSVFVLPVYADYEHVSNGGFESGLSGWAITSSNSTYVTVNTVNFYGGVQSVKMEWNYYGGWCAVGQVVDYVRVADISEFTFWVLMGTEYGGVDVFFNFSDSTTGNIGFGPIYEGAWREQDIASELYTTYGDKSMVGFVIRSLTQSNVYVDDVSLVASSPLIIDPSGTSWVEVPNFVSFLVLFVVMGLPAMVLGMAGAKGGWGLQGLLFGGLLGLGAGVCVGLVPFWFVFLIGLFVVLLLYSMASRS